MAKPLKSKKTTTPSPTKSWGDIAKLKKSIDIKFEDEVIFTMVELPNKKLPEFIDIMQSKYKDEEDTTPQSIISMDHTELIAFALRNTVEGIDFGEMTDEEIVDNLNEMSDIVIEQVNDALSELVINKVVKRLESLNKFAEEFANKNGVLN